jgi:hypothetical protein
MANETREGSGPAASNSEAPDTSAAMVTRRPVYEIHRGVNRRV